MTLAFLYRRTSTGRQNYSLEAQEKHCDDYCQRLRFQVVGFFDDPEISTRTPLVDRDGGRAMLSAIEQCRRDNPNAPIALVVCKQDRLGRDTVDQITTIRKLWAMNVTPHLVLETGPLAKNPNNELLMEIKASANQYERSMIRERIQTTLDHRRAQGFASCSPGYGFDKVGTGQVNPVTHKEICRMVDNGYEQQWLKQMAEWRNDGWSYQQIAARMNELGVPTKIPVGTMITVKRDRKTGVKLKAAVIGGWKPITVHKILRSRSTIDFLFQNRIQIKWRLPQKPRNVREYYARLLAGAAEEGKAA